MRDITMGLVAGATTTLQAFGVVSPSSSSTPCSPSGPTSIGRINPSPVAKEIINSSTKAITKNRREAALSSFAAPSSIGRAERSSNIRVVVRIRPPPRNQSRLSSSNTTTSMQETTTQNDKNTTSNQIPVCKYCHNDSNIYPVYDTRKKQNLNNESPFLSSIIENTNKQSLQEKSPSSVILGSEKWFTKGVNMFQSDDTAPPLPNDYETINTSNDTADDNESYCSDSTSTFSIPTSLIVSTTTCSHCCNSKNHSLASEQPQRLGQKKKLQFDAVFNEETTQTVLYDRSVGDAVRRNIFRGYNTTIIGYGKSKTGKTYTMMGSIRNDHTTGSSIEESDGVIPRAIYDLFKAKKQCYNTSGQVTVYLKYIQIYKNQIRDLLTGKNAKSIHPPQQDPQNDKDEKTHPFSSIQVESYKQVMELITQANNENSHPSSSYHTICILQVTIFSPGLSSSSSSAPTENYTTSDSLTAELTLVDLGSSSADLGILEQVISALAKTNNNDSSENDIEDTNTNEEEEDEELVNVSHNDITVETNNTSTVRNNNTNQLQPSPSSSTLSASVQKQQNQQKLSTNTPHYQDSKLLWFLKESIGGNCCTVLIACISPTTGCPNNNSILSLKNSHPSLLNNSTNNERNDMDHDYLLNFQNSMNTLHYANETRSIINSIKQNIIKGKNEEKSIPKRNIQHLQNENHHPVTPLTPSIRKNLFDEFDSSPPPTIPSTPSTASTASSSLSTIKLLNDENQRLKEQIENLNKQIQLENASNSSFFSTCEDAQGISNPIQHQQEEMQKENEKKQRLMEEQQQKQQQIIDEKEEEIKKLQNQLNQLKGGIRSMKEKDRIVRMNLRARELELDTIHNKIKFLTKNESKIMDILEERQLESQKMAASRSVIGKKGEETEVTESNNGTTVVVATNSSNGETESNNGTTVVATNSSNGEISGSESKCTVQSVQLKSGNKINNHITPIISIADSVSDVSSEQVALSHISYMLNRFGMTHDEQQQELQQRQQRVDNSNNHHSDDEVDTAATALSTSCSSTNTHVSTNNDYGIKKDNNHNNANIQKEEEDQVTFTKEDFIILSELNKKLRIQLDSLKVAVKTKFKDLKTQLSTEKDKRRKYESICKDLKNEVNCLKVEQEEKNQQLGVKIDDYEFKIKETQKEVRSKQKEYENLILELKDDLIKKNDELNTSEVEKQKIRFEFEQLLNEFNELHSEFISQEERNKQKIKLVETQHQTEKKELQDRNESLLNEKNRYHFQLLHNKKEFEERISELINQSIDEKRSQEEKEQHFRKLIDDYEGLLNENDALRCHVLDTSMDTAGTYSGLANNTSMDTATTTSSTKHRRVISNLKAQLKDEKKSQQQAESRNQKLKEDFQFFILENSKIDSKKESQEEEIIQKIKELEDQIFDQTRLIQENEHLLLDNKELRSKIVIIENEFKAKNIHLLAQFANEKKQLEDDYESRMSKLKDRFNALSVESETLRDDFEKLLNQSKKEIYDLKQQVVSEQQLNSQHVLQSNELKKEIEALSNENTELLCELIDNDEYSKKEVNGLKSQLFLNVDQLLTGIEQRHNEKSKSSGNNYNNNISNQIKGGSMTSNGFPESKEEDFTTEFINQLDVPLVDENSWFLQQQKQQEGHINSNPERRIDPDDTCYLGPLEPLSNASNNHNDNKTSQHRPGSLNCSGTKISNNNNNVLIKDSKSHLFDEKRKVESNETNRNMNLKNQFKRYSSPSKYKALKNDKGIDNNKIDQQIENEGNQKDKHHGENDLPNPSQPSKKILRRNISWTGGKKNKKQFLI